jgi:hypothetical protein
MKKALDFITASDPGDVIIGAIMNKLLHIIYGVLKHQKPFDPEYLKKHEKSA